MDGAFAGTVEYYLMRRRLSGWSMCSVCWKTYDGEIGPVYRVEFDRDVAEFAIEVLRISVPPLDEKLAEISSVQYVPCPLAMFDRLEPLCNSPRKSH